MLMLMDLRGCGEVDWIWRGTKSKNIILIYGASVWSEIKARFSLFRDEQRQRFAGASVTKLVNFSLPTEAFRVKLLGEEERRKSSPKAESAYCTTSTNSRKQARKNKENVRKNFFCFLGATINLFNLIIRCFASSMEWASEREKVWHVFAFRLHSPSVVDTNFCFVLGEKKKSCRSVTSVGNVRQPRPCEKHLSCRQNKLSFSELLRVPRKNWNFFNSKRTTLSGFSVGSISVACEKFQESTPPSKVNCCSVDRHRSAGLSYDYVRRKIDYNYL